LPWQWFCSAGGGRWFHRGESIEEVSSDKELEAAAQSWLKTSGPLGESSVYFK